MSRDYKIDFDTRLCTMPGCVGLHERGKCRGHRCDRSGRACQRHPVRGAAVSTNRGASAPQVRHAARIRLLEAADLPGPHVAPALLLVRLRLVVPGRGGRARPVRAGGVPKLRYSGRLAPVIAGEPRSAGFRQVA